MDVPLRPEHPHSLALSTPTLSLYSHHCHPQQQAFSLMNPKGSTNLSFFLCDLKVIYFFVFIQRPRTRPSIGKETAYSVLPPFPDLIGTDRRRESDNPAFPRPTREKERAGTRMRFPKFVEFRSSCFCKSHLEVLVFWGLWCLWAFASYFIMEGARPRASF